MAAAGDSVILECRVEALPKPTIAFWRDANGRTPVIDGPNYTIQLLSDPEVNMIYITNIIRQITGRWKEMVVLTVCRIAVESLEKYWSILYSILKFNDNSAVVKPGTCQTFVVFDFCVFSDCIYPVDED